MQTFQKKKRLLHVKSVESIMLRQNSSNTKNHNELNNKSCKSYRISKLGPSSMTNSLLKKGQNITQINQNKNLHMSKITCSPKNKIFMLTLTNSRDYLKKYELQKQNINLARRIAESNATINHEKLDEDWQILKNYLKVRSKFKKNIQVVEPRIFKLEKKIGYGNNLFKLSITKLNLQKNIQNNCYLYYLIFKIGKRKFKTRMFSYASLLSESFHINAPKNLVNNSFFIFARIIQIKGTFEFDKGKFKIQLKDQTTQSIVSKDGIQNGSIVLNVKKIMNE